MEECDVLTGILTSTLSRRMTAEHHRRTRLNAKLAASVLGPLKRINLFCPSLSDRERNVARPEANPPHSDLPQSAQFRSEVVAGGEGLLDKWKVLLSPWRARNLLGHLQTSIRRRGEELMQRGLIQRR